MKINQRKKEFSQAYVQAVAAVAGLTHSVDSVDDDSIDMRLSAASSYIVRAPRLEAQLKCTQDQDFEDGFLKYDLKLKNYEDLSVDCSVPRILVVVVVPPTIEEWLLHDEHSMALHHCGYWVSLANRPPTTNESSVRVRLPRHQIFNVAGLLDIMHKISREESL